MSASVTRRSIMTLYADACDPVGHGVRIVLSEKDVSVEVNFVDQETKPEDLNDLNPYRAILTLVDRDLVLYDSQIMMEYLDERYPHPPLMPVDPIARANNRQFRYRVMRDLYGALHELDAGGGDASASARNTLRDNLLAIAPIFSQHPYFLSSEYTLVDCCLAPLLWRLDHYGIRLGPLSKPLVRYAESLFGREAFRASLSPAERRLHH